MDGKSQKHNREKDMLYLEQLKIYVKHTKNTPENVRAMAMYNQALEVIEERYNNIDDSISKVKKDNREKK